MCDAGGMLEDKKKCHKNAQDKITLWLPPLGKWPNVSGCRILTFKVQGQAGDSQVLILALEFYDLDLLRWNSDLKDPMYQIYRKPFLGPFR